MTSAAWEMKGWQGGFGDLRLDTLEGLCKLIEEKKLEEMYRELKSPVQSHLSSTGSGVIGVS